jgi:ABC-type nickel/cobalt efflux system permease component RcnA
MMRARLLWICLGLTLGLVLGALAFDMWASVAFAQNPFGAPRSASPPVPSYGGGITGWLLAKQAEFYRAMSGAIRDAKTDGSAVGVLLGISFLYGIFHAAGPGHGKAVISSYMVANEETARRGIILSFASALLQALVAILIVGGLALLLRATSQTMCNAERIVEIVSYGLIALLGARLVWIKGRGFVAGLRARNAAAHAPAPHNHAHGHDHAAHDHHHDHTHHDHNHNHNHDHDHAHCGHSHGPAPKDLAGPGGLWRGLAAIFAMGLRPCSGAILVLVFALAQGLFWAGIAATFVMGLGTAITVSAFALIAIGARKIAARMANARDGRGAMVLRGIELAAACLVLVFGIALLSGYLAAERGACF